MAGIALGAVLALSGGGILVHEGVTAPSDAGAVPGSSGAAPDRGAPTAPSGPSGPRGVASARATPVPDPGSPPVAVRIPALGVEARVRPVGVGPDGTLGVPSSPDVLGWWSAGARPGSGTGTVVIDGHVDSARYGLGAFYHLGDAPIGSTVGVRTRDGRWLAYRVVARRIYHKAKLPAEVFERSGRPRLVLITCTGSFDRHTRRYSDNLVVYAVPTSTTAAPFIRGPRAAAR